MNIFHFICGFLLLALVDSATTVPTTHAHTVEAPTTLHPVTTLTPEQECAARNSSCEACLKLAKCLYCKSSRQCTPYPVGKVLPPSSVCQLDDARWGVCWLNFEALIISMGVIGGLIIVVVTVCICCCCCCKDNKKKYAKEDEKWERKKADRKEKANEKKAERRAKTDEIRRKYGLVKDDNPYERFENA